MNIAVDTETYYSKTYSIRDLGNWAYVNHPEFNCYMLTAAYEDGRKWAGHPRDFEWESLNGHTMIMHNAGFDTAVLTRLCELGVARSFAVAEIFDTADMAAYLGYPRSLASASSGLLGVKMDKTTRDKMKGQQWDDMAGEMQTEVLEYATCDVVQTLALWMKHGHRWPQDEREISRITREMCATGLPINVPRVKEAVGQLEILLAKVRAQIPWAAGDPDAKALSPKAVKIECEKNGILAPKSMAKDSEEFDEWLKKHGETMTWAKAMSQYRSINMFLKKLHTIVIRSHEESPGVYVMPFSLKYCGAHTLRDSGDAGFNPQNLPRDPMFGPELAAAEIADSAGIDMRGFIEAPPGFQLAVVDLSAIEPCSLAVLSGDWELVDMLEGGMDPYEAQARIDGEYDGSEPLKDVNKGLRQYNKVKVLGCGYGAGAPKVKIIAATMVGVELTDEESEVLVAKFRSREFIPGLWGTLERGMRMSAGRIFRMEVPNGGEMLYRDVKNFGRSLSAVIPRQGRFMTLKYWGGVLTENLVQRVARDVFMDTVLRLEAAGLPPILRVHDEAVCLVPNATAEADLARMTKIMSTRPTWMPDLPLRAEGHLCVRYAIN